MVPGIYSEPFIRHRNFVPKMTWFDSTMKKIMEYDIPSKS